MPHLGPYTTRTFHLNLYSGMLRTIVINKRGTEQNQGTGTNLTLYNCRRKKIYYGGQNIRGQMTSNDYTVWQIPRVELDRVGIVNLNIVDTITDQASGEVWQPESDDVLIRQLFDNFVNVPCKRIV